MRRVTPIGIRIPNIRNNVLAFTLPDPKPDCNMLRGGERGPDTRRSPRSVPRSFASESWRSYMSSWEMSGKPQGFMGRHGGRAGDNVRAQEKLSKELPGEFVIGSLSELMDTRKPSVNCRD